MENHPVNRLYFECALEIRGATRIDQAVFCDAEGTEPDADGPLYCPAHIATVRVMAQLERQFGIAPDSYDPEGAP